MPIGKRIKSFAGFVMATVLVNSASAMTVVQFGSMPDGRMVNEYILTNSRGSEASVIALGATLRALKVRDRKGAMRDVVLGYDTLQEYLEGPAYFGATIGRYANRIANGELTIDNTTYHLSTNSGPNSLHGGAHGFNKVLWSQDPGARMAKNSVRLEYVSADGEEGFPGELTVRVTYTLTDADELKIEYRAQTSSTTVVNFTNHSYFNLGGAGDGEVVNERLTLAADGYTPVGESGIPSGVIQSVAGSDYDFRAPVELGKRLAAATDSRVVAMHGFDSNFVLSDGEGRLRYAATLQDPASGLELTVYTTEPGLQLFTPDFPAHALKGKQGKYYGGRAAVCLETQHFPDSPHNPQFPTTLLRRGQTFHSESVYRFRTLR
jgi:aldose 1-epimerase